MTSLLDNRRHSNYIVYCSQSTSNPVRSPGSQLLTQANSISLSTSSLYNVRTHNRILYMYFLAITIHIILFAGDEMDSYFVESVITSVATRTWRLILWFWAGWVYLQLPLNIWYKLGLANDFSNLIWEALPIVLIYSTLTKYLDEHFLEANRASVWKLWLSICGIIMI